MIVICDCPQCGLPSDVEVHGAIVADSLTWVKTSCPAGHWNVMPGCNVEGLTTLHI